MDDGYGSKIRTIVIIVALFCTIFLAKCSHFCGMTIKTLGSKSISWQPGLALSIITSSGSMRCLPSDVAWCFTWRPKGLVLQKRSKQWIGTSGAYPKSFCFQFGLIPKEQIGATKDSCSQSSFGMNQVLMKDQAWALAGHQNQRYF